MNSDIYALDHSGYGPTGIGNAPTARDMRAQQMNRFRSDRMSSSMQFIDPYVTGAAGTTMQALTNAGNSPDAARRAVFQSAGGQVAMDAAMMARRAGFLGQGDPVNYAHNVASGIAGGGFQTTFGGTMEGRQVHGRGQVSGQGALSERVSTGFQKSLLSNLYGSGTPDPSKLHGFDMEEASGVFNKLARRGVVGEVAHVERNASLQNRLAAGRDGAVDPSIKSALAGVQLSGLSEEKDVEELNKVIEKTSDPKIKREMEKIRDSTDAVVISEAEQKKVSKLVESVTKGMASLSDIYGDLSSEELNQKLEEVSGMRITNQSQARQANEMVSQMRGAAVISGMDPRAYAEYSAHQQGLLQGDVMKAGGFDGRTATQSVNTTAVLNRTMMDDAAIASKLSGQDAMRAGELGIDSGEGPTLDEVYEDKRQGRIDFLNKYKVVAMTKGGMDNFSGDQRKRMEGLQAEFEATENLTDPQEQAEARAQIKSRMEGEWGDLYGGDFSMAASSRAGQLAVGDAYSDPAKAREMEQMAMVGRRNAINLNPVVGMLDEMGAGGGMEQAEQFRDKIGLGGMTDLLRDSKSDDTAEVRMQNQRNILAQSGIEGDEADEFMNRFFDDEGRMKDEDGFKQVAGYIGRSGWEGGQSEYDQKKVGAERMAALGADSNRVRLRAEDQTVSVNSIATSLLTGASKGVSDPESMALMMQAMADEGIALPKFGSVDKDGNPIMKSAEESYATGIDFSGGLTEEGLGKLEKLQGKSLDLHTKMGYGSREEMIAASKKDSNITADAMEMMRTDEDYAGLNLAGDQYNITALTDEAKEGLGKTGELDAYARKLGGGMLINRSLGMTEDESTASLKADGGFDSSRFEADGFTSVAGKWNPFSSNRAEMGEGLGRNLNLSGLVGSASEDGMKSLGALDEDGALSEKLQAQYAELEKAKLEGGGDLAVEYKGEGGKSASTTVDDAMKSIQAAMTKLAEANAGAKGLQAVEEMTVKVLRVENSTTVN